VLLLASFVFVGIFGTILPAEIPQIRLATQVIYGIGLALWAALRLGREPRRLEIPIAAALVAMLIASLFSRDIQGSLNVLGGGLSFALLFFAMQDVREPVRRGSIALGVVGALTAWLAVFAIRWSGEKVAWIASGGGIPNLFDSTQTLFWLSTNTISVLSLLGIAFLGYLPAGAPSKMLSRAFLVTSALVVPMSGGRAGWLGLAVAGLLMLALLNDRVRPRLTTTRLLVGVLILAVIPILVTVIGLSGPYVPGLSARLPLWHEAVAIFAADPLTGGGPGTFSWLRLEQIPTDYLFVPSSHAHNLPLQTAADGGLLMLAALCSLGGFAAAYVWNRRSALSETAQRSASVLLGFIVASLLDDFSSLPAITAMLVTLAAWLIADSETKPARRATTRHHYGILAVSAVLAFVALPAVAGVDLARLVAAHGREAYARGDLSVAADDFESAIRWYPANPAYHLSSGLALAEAGREAEARTEFEAATTLAPADARAWGGLAALTADSDRRITLLSLAARQPTFDPQFAFRLATELGEQNRPGETQLAFVRALVRLPALILNSQDDLAAQEIARATVDFVDQLGPASRLPADLILWDLIAAGAISGQDLPPAWQGVAALRNHRIEEAQQAINRAIRDQPMDADTWRAARALAMFQCDDAARLRAQALLNLLPGGRIAAYPPAASRAPDLAYREEGLGSYQPGPPVIPLALMEWPEALLPAPPSCPP
jgi:Flp pilus assembly protein TadD